MPINLFELYKNLAQEEVLFCFCGSVSQNIVEGIGETLCKRMEREGEESTVIGKVFPIFVEQVQNIVSHSAERIPPESSESEELSFGIVIVGKSKNQFFVSCGNYINNVNIEPLRSRLETLIGMSKEELKLAYKQQLKESRKPDVVGSGLGLIDMARRAGEPLKYQFIPVDETKSFLIITSII